MPATLKCIRESMKCQPTARNKGTQTHPHRDRIQQGSAARIGDTYSLVQMRQHPSFVLRRRGWASGPSGAGCRFTLRPAG
jgi:hypothetical protein